MSEELENSLQQAVETYLNDRLRTINDQISQLQTSVNETISRLQETSAAQTLEGTTLSAAIFAHLQTARGQRLSGASTAPPAGLDAGALKRAVAGIEAQESQTDILKALLQGAAQFAERSALFVVKSGQAIGWRVCLASDPEQLELIGGVSLPLDSQTSLTRAIHSQSSWSGAARENAEDQVLLDQLGGAAESAAVFPLVVRRKVVAALYADSGSTEPNAINADALEVLAKVAAMAVNILSVQRAATESRPEATAPAISAAPAAATGEESAAVDTYVPSVEAQKPEPAPAAEEAQPASWVTPAQAADEQPEAASWTMPASEAVTESTEPTSWAAPEAETAVESADQSAWTVPVAEPAPEAPPEEPAAEPAAAAADSEPARFTEPTPYQPAPPPEPAASAPPPAAPAFNSHFATPLGTTRRYGVTEPDLPIDIGEEERRLHNDARRFARLLVSEIKLYNENKVKEGRSNADLYERLREDIDRSRQMYDKRVAPPVAARHDYFHQELVNLLAEGDPAKLGHSYPGANAG